MKNISGNTWGDPHIITLDGLGYTFNGLGCYWMVKTTNRTSDTDPFFNMQAQTARVVTSNGTMENATVFTRFAAQDNGSDIIEIELVKPNGNLFYI